MKRDSTVVDHKNAAMSTGLRTVNRHDRAAMFLICSDTLFHQRTRMAYLIRELKRRGMLRLITLAIH